MNCVRFSLESLFAKTIEYLPAYEAYQMVGTNQGFRGIINLPNGAFFTSEDIKTICGSTDIRDFDGLAQYCASLAVDIGENAV